MEFTIPVVNFTPILPEIVLVGTALLVLLVAAYTERRRWLAAVSIVGLLVAALLSFLIPVNPPQTFQGMLVVDHYALYVNLVVLLASFLALLLSYYYTPKFTGAQGGYYSLILLATAGMMTMAAATDLVTIFLALETLSLSLYVLAGYNRKSPRSGEAALKYMLLGSFSSAFFLYGIALAYAATGTTNLAEIAGGKTLAGGSLLWYVAGGLLLVGFGFKISVVPFHMWTPDVYQGAPTPVTAFMAVGAKAAGFAALMRAVLYAMGGMKSTWEWAFAVLALLTMTLGNLAALRQVSVKRMLAYSSIAQAGYMLVGVVAVYAAGAASSFSGINGVLLYLFAYLFTNAGAFLVVAGIEEKGGFNDIASYDGLVKTSPLAAGLMVVFLFSLAGIPSTGGFIGKFMVFGSAIERGYYVLALVAILNTVVAAAYYLKIVQAMFFKRPLESSSIPLSKTLVVAIVIAVVMVFWIGIFPQNFIELASQSVAVLLAP